MTKLDGCNSLKSVQELLVVLGVVDMCHLLLSIYFLRCHIFVLLVANFSQYRGYPTRSLKAGNDLLYIKFMILLKIVSKQYPYVTLAMFS